jgi:hypothetical protein
MHKGERLTISTSRESREILDAMKINHRLAGQTVTITNVASVGVSFEDVRGKEWHITSEQTAKLFPIVRVHGKVRAIKPVAIKTFADL